jgi:NAD(P)H-dependent FMN reductase
VKPLHVAVIYGSVRAERQGIKAARVAVQALRGRGQIASLVDALASPIPLLDRMYKEYPRGEAPEILEELAQLYRSVDGFAVVSGEYNHGIPPALKNLLDHFLEEYAWRPAAIVSYSAGRFGGVRAAMQLRMSLAEMGMVTIPSMLPIPRVQDAFDDEGTPLEARFASSAVRFWDEFDWYMRALHVARAQGVPYGGFL